MSQQFNPYHQWLGIAKGKLPPTHYDLLGISLDEEEQGVIQNAAQRQRTHVEQYKAGDHSKYAKQVIYQIDEAELTLLDTELRRNYDNQVGLYGKRKKSRRYERVGGKSHPSSSGVEQSSGFFREYLGVMSVILACFVIMAIVSLSLSSTNKADQKSSEGGSFAPVTNVVQTERATPNAANNSSPAESDSVSENTVAAKTNLTVPLPQNNVSGDDFPVDSLWKGDGEHKGFKLTVLERNGNRFKARFESEGWVRVVSGTAIDRAISWTGKDVQVIKGNAGGDNQGTIVTDGDGMRIDFVWRGGDKSGTFTLRKQD